MLAVALGVGGRREEQHAEEVLEARGVLTNKEYLVFSGEGSGEETFDQSVKRKV